jgi:hypothetical protein
MYHRNRSLSQLFIMFVTRFGTVSNYALDGIHCMLRTPSPICNSIIATFHSCEILLSSVFPFTYYIYKSKSDRVVRSSAAWDPVAWVPEYLVGNNCRRTGILHRFISSGQHNPDASAKKSPAINFNSPSEDISRDRVIQVLSKIISKTSLRYLFGI